MGNRHALQGLPQHTNNWWMQSRIHSTAPKGNLPTELLPKKFQGPVCNDLTAVGSGLAYGGSKGLSNDSNGSMKGELPLGRVYIRINTLLLPGPSSLVERDLYAGGVTGFWFKGVEAFNCLIHVGSHQSSCVGKLRHADS